MRSILGSLLLQFSLLIVLLNSASAIRFRNFKVLSDSADPEEFKTFFFNQTLDHFNYKPESYGTFQQRYYINSKYWGGGEASAPIFVFLGAEAPMNDADVTNGLLNENAARFHSLLLYIEHRYYGKSIPFGSREEAFKNASTLGYFNSAQALSDYAAIINHVKKENHAEMSPVIVAGGSYGGMLASWFRLKYPHIALGALASSAPLLYFDDITPEDGYHSIVTKSFREASETCYQTILKSWGEIDKVASQPGGLSNLSETFITCNPLNNTTELKYYLEKALTYTAQYNSPPNYLVNMVCNAVDHADAYGLGNDTLSKIAAGVVVYANAVTRGGNQTCFVNPSTYESESINPPTYESESKIGWGWQRCSEMVMPIAPSNNTMFQAHPFNFNAFTKNCIEEYGVPPRPHWVTTYYGGHNIKLILERFGSNIIFSNGLKDPYSSGGVLQNISDTVVAVTTVNGSHCLDLDGTRKTDPDWLTAQRNSELTIIEGWISNPLKNTAELKNYLEWALTSTAQYNSPPNYLVNSVCNAVDHADAHGFGNDTLSKIAAGVVVYANATRGGNQTCFVNPPTYESETDIGWSWQTCSEMVMPIAPSNNTMFEPHPFDFNAFTIGCIENYGVPPRPHWVTTYYGGHNIKLILERFSSNIIFSNGLKDPYSSGGVLQNISDTVVAVTTGNGSHCLDLDGTRKTDPDWLTAQRNSELTIIEGWISKYYDDLRRQ
ncbi:hypothetical protein Tsubulata_010864 [Turnera subulata]|uniref:Uncharacterized protein n=1 Tax=Turnera subulata TaxID=218843 RepID=A0A9Q0JCD9_9ROSI|nr:hypothetical protein Tsubulata_010864 [Turnera subulata]